MLNWICTRPDRPQRAALVSGELIGPNTAYLNHANDNPVNGDNHNKYDKAYRRKLPA